MKNSTVSCKMNPLQKRQLNLRATQLNTTVSELLRTSAFSLNDLFIKIRNYRILIMLFLFVIGGLGIYIYWQRRKQKMMDAEMNWLNFENRRLLRYAKG